MSNRHHAVAAETLHDSSGGAPDRYEVRLLR